MADEVAKRAIDRITAHFASTKGKRQSVDTAWGFKVWTSPWTLGEKDAVFGADPVFRPRSNARLLVIKAEDENGRRLFHDLDERELLNEADPDEVSRVALAILQLLNADQDAAREGGEGSGPKH